MLQSASKLCSGTTAKESTSVHTVKQACAVTATASVDVSNSGSRQIYNDSGEIYNDQRSPVGRVLKISNTSTDLKYNSDDLSRQFSMKKLSPKQAREYQEAKQQLERESINKRRAVKLNSTDPLVNQYLAQAMADAPISDSTDSLAKFKKPENRDKIVNSQIRTLLYLLQSVQNTGSTSTKGIGVTATPEEQKLCQEFSLLSKDYQVYIVVSLMRQQDSEIGTPLSIISGLSSQPLPVQNFFKSYNAYLRKINSRYITPTVQGDQVDSVDHLPNRFSSNDPPREEYMQSDIIINDLEKANILVGTQAGHLRQLSEYILHALQDEDQKEFDHYSRQYLILIVSYIGSFKSKDSLKEKLLRLGSSSVERSSLLAEYMQGADAAKSSTSSIDARVISTNSVKAITEFRDTILAHIDNINAMATQFIMHNRNPSYFFAGSHYALKTHYNRLSTGDKLAAFNIVLAYVDGEAAYTERMYKRTNSNVREFFDAFQRHGDLECAIRSVFNEESRGGIDTVDGAHMHLRVPVDNPTPVGYTSPLVNFRTYLKEGIATGEKGTTNVARHRYKVSCLSEDQRRNYYRGVIECEDFVSLSIADQQSLLRSFLQLDKELKDCLMEYVNLMYTFGGANQTSDASGLKIRYNKFSNMEKVLIFNMVLASIDGHKESSGEMYKTSKAQVKAFYDEFMKYPMEVACKAVFGRDSVVEDHVDGAHMHLRMPHDNPTPVGYTSPLVNFRTYPKEGIATGEKGNTKVARHRYKVSCLSEDQRRNYYRGVIECEDFVSLSIADQQSLLRSFLQLDKYLKDCLMEYVELCKEEPVQTRIIEDGVDSVDSSYSPIQSSRVSTASDFGGKPLPNKPVLAGVVYVFSTLAKKDQETAYKMVKAFWNNNVELADYMYNKEASSELRSFFDILTMNITSSPGVAERAIQTVETIWPDLQGVPCLAMSQGYFGSTPSVTKTVNHYPELLKAINCNALFEEYSALNELHREAADICLQKFEALAYSSRSLELTRDFVYFQISQPHEVSQFIDSVLHIDIDQILPPRNLTDDVDGVTKKMLKRCDTKHNLDDIVATSKGRKSYHTLSLPISDADKSNDCLSKQVYTNCKKLKESNSPFKKEKNRRDSCITDIYAANLLTRSVCTQMCKISADIHIAQLYKEFSLADDLMHKLLDTFRDGVVSTDYPVKPEGLTKAGLNRSSEKYYPASLEKLKAKIVTRGRENLTKDQTTTSNKQGDIVRKAVISLERLDYALRLRKSTPENLQLFDGFLHSSRK